MKYQRFEQLPVWQDAVRLAVAIDALIEKGCFRGKEALRGQMERAALSISNNVAEGFERGTTNELLYFIYVARGSAGEVRSMLCVMERLPQFGAVGGEISRLKELAEGIGRQLRGWADSLQNSDISGQRHLNAAVRERYERRQRVSALQERIDEIMRERVREMRGTADGEGAEGAGG